MPLKKEFDHVMVDIETTGVNPAKAAHIQIAARPFCLETGEMCDEYFEACLHVPENRGWESGCVEWWTSDEDRKETLKYIKDNRQDYMEVMTNFRHFVLDNCKHIGVEFWSNHTLDWEFIQSYMFDYGWENPFHFSNYRELNSFVGGVLRTSDRKTISDTRPEQPTSHNAIEDVDYQIKWLFSVMGK